MLTDMINKFERCDNLALDIRYKLDILDIQNGIVKFLLTVISGTEKYLYELWFDIEKRDVVYEKVIIDDKIVEAINLYEFVYNDVFNEIYDIFFKVA